MSLPDDADQCAELSTALQRCSLVPYVDEQAGLAPEEHGVHQGSHRTCTVCSASVDSMTEPKEHRNIKRHHMRRSRARRNKSECLVRNIKYSLGYNPRAQLRTVWEEPIACPVCSEVFSQADLLRTHIRIHT